MPQRMRNLLKSEDINRVFVTKRREGSVLRMEEMTNQCTTATGSSRVRFVCETAATPRKLVFGVIHVPAFERLYKTLGKQVF